MSTFKRLFVLALLGLSLQACDSSDGPLERSGETLDDAAEDAADAVEDAADRLQNNLNN